MTDEKTRALITDLREYATALRASVQVHHIGADLIEQAADTLSALSALTVPDGDARERLLAVLSRHGHVEWDALDVAVVADAVLAAFPVLSRAAAPEPEWEFGVQYIPPSAYAGEPVECGSERAARLAVCGSNEPIRLLRRRPEVVHPAGPWEPLPVGGETA